MTGKWKIFGFLYYCKYISSAGQATQIVNEKYSKNCFLFITFQVVTRYIEHKALHVHWPEVTSWLEELQEQRYGVICGEQRSALCHLFIRKIRVRPQQTLRKPEQPPLTPSVGLNAVAWAVPGSLLNGRFSGTTNGLRNLNLRFRKVPKQSV